MYTVLLIEDDEVNQLIAQKNISSIDEDMQIKVVDSYKSALLWIKNNEMPDGIITNLHVWSSSYNVFTFFNDLLEELAPVSIPVFVSALSISHEQQMKLLEFNNYKCLLSSPLNFVDAAIVVNQLQSQNMNRLESTS